jgi:hypothetical protein
MTRCRECERATARVRRESVLSTPAPDGTATRRATRGDRAFGVELEVNGSRELLLTALRERDLGSSWRITFDGSLGSRGLELVSPPLRGADGFDQLRRACEALSVAGCTIDRSCGLHVHVDLSGISANAVRRMVKAYCASQDIIDGMLSESRRGRRNHYCQPWDAEALAQLDSCRSIEDMSHRQDDRYTTVNLAAYPRHGTIEFRQHQGTTSYRKVEAWVKFVAALVQTCVRNEVARQGSVAEVMTAFGADEDTAAYLIGRAVQFNATTVMPPPPVTSAAAEYAVMTSAHTGAHNPLEPDRNPDEDRATWQSELDAAVNQIAEDNDPTADLPF